jgi:hypothetical protein
MTKNIFMGLLEQYVPDFWNTIGGLYLTRHNFETRATNAADGGVFCVSARAVLLRTCIVKDATFTHAFLNEYILRFGDKFPGWGPVVVDEDKFFSRRVVNHG